jgi:hypothetical protein
VTNKDDLEKEYLHLLAGRGLDKQWRETRDMEDHSWPLGDDGSTLGMLDLNPARDAIGTITGALNYMAADLERAIAMRGWERYLDTPVYVGEYPHNTFNAQAIPVPGGTLILLNDGYFFLVHRVTRLLAASLIKDKKGVTQGPIPEGVDPALYDHARLRAELCDAFWEYYSSERGADEEFRDRYPIRFNEEGYIASLLRDSCEKFALAHEYGHVLGGDFGYSRNLASVSLRGVMNPEWLRTSREDELEADTAGCNIIIAQPYDRWQALTDPSAEFPSRMRNPIEQWLELRDRWCRVTAPYIFFAIDRVVRDISTKVFGHGPAERGESTHPTSKKRLAELKPMLRSAFTQREDFTYADAFPKFLRKEAAAIVRESQRRYAKSTMRSPGR